MCDSSFFWWFICCEAVHHCRWDNNTMLSNDDIQHRTENWANCLGGSLTTFFKCLFFSNKRARISLPKIDEFLVQNSTIEWNRVRQWVNFTERKSRQKSSAEYAHKLPLTLESLSLSISRLLQNFKIRTMLISMRCKPKRQRRRDSSTRLKNSQVRRVWSEY